MALKLKKLPKRPKASASPKVWENYERRLKDVQSDNGKKMQEEKKKQQIQKRTEGASKVKASGGKRKR